MMGAAIREAAARLEAAGVPSPRVDAVALLAHVMGTDPADLERQTILGSTMTRDQEDRFADLIGQREQRIPLQHLTGVAWFRRLELGVGPDVFVPRPETELTVELALAVLREQATGEQVPIMVDLCCGSGAIGLSVKDEMVTAAVTCVDIAEGAISRTLENASRHGLQVATVHADVTAEELPEELGELAGRVDVVATNPPYVPLGAVPKDPEVRDHDPRIALYGGSDDGLAIPLKVARTAAALLRDGGTLVMEHADVQGESLSEQLRATGLWEDVEDHLDLNGLPRSVSAVRVAREGARSDDAAQAADDVAGDAGAAEAGPDEGAQQTDDGRAASGADDAPMRAGEPDDAASSDFDEPSPHEAERAVADAHDARSAKGGRPTATPGNDAADPANDPSFSAPSDTDPRPAASAATTSPDPQERPVTTPPDPKDRPRPKRHVPRVDDSRPARD